MKNVIKSGSTCRKQGFWYFYYAEKGYKVPIITLCKKLYVLGVVGFWVCFFKNNLRGIGRCRMFALLND